MAAAPDTGKRCVIWFGNPGAREKVMLAADGWQVRAVLPQQPAEIGMRDGDVVVGLIDFRTSSDSELERIARLTAEHRHMPLFALTPADDGHVLHPLLSSCQRQFPHPPDLKDLLRQLRAEGLGILVVEHDMEFVMNLADRITVLEFGCVISRGTPHQVQRDQRVLDAYLGGGDDLPGAEAAP